MAKSVTVGKYCPSCGRDVEVYTMFTPEGEIDRCQICSSIIPRESAPAAAVPLELGLIYVVEDTALLREMIKDILLIREMGKEVRTCKNGAEFLSLYTGDLIKRQRPTLVMLDVVMPILNGVNAAVAMRSVESAFGAERTPVLFFTVRECDENFKKILKYCSPAMYINKGTDGSPSKMQTRVEMVVSQLWKEVQEGGLGQ